MDALTWLQPDGLSLFATWVLILGSAATSFLTAATGIGGGIALLALMTSLMPVATLIPVHGVVQIGSNAGRTLIMLRNVRYTILLPFLLGSLAGSALGGVFVMQLSPGLLQIALSIFILWSAWFKPPKTPAGNFTIGMTGVVSSFLTMFFGATGMFVSAMLKTMRLDRLTHVATHSSCMTAQHAIKVLAFGLLGFAYGPYIALICAMILSGFIGTILGKRFLEKMTDERFHLALSIVLTLLALRLLWAGLSSYLGF
jgi:uncharacterized membrane protein YfcA